MEVDRIARLTDAQREVLRRWQVRRSAKEIAIELGITHWAVNERLRLARGTLAGLELDVAVHDHLLVGRIGWTSMRARGLL